MDGSVLPGAKALAIDLLLLGVNGALWLLQVLSVPLVEGDLRRREDTGGTRLTTGRWCKGEI